MVGSKPQSMSEKQLAKSRKAVNFVFLCGMAIGMTGCDTRDDWFQKEGEGATFIIETGDRKDTIDIIQIKSLSTRALKGITNNW